MSCGFVNAQTVSVQSPKAIITITDNDEYTRWKHTRENLFNRIISWCYYVEIYI